MHYDEVNDEYICLNNIKLKPIGIKTRTSKSGYKSEITIYEASNCNACLHKQKCTKAKGNRQIQVSKMFLEKRSQSLENITRPEGVLLRMNRSIQVEGAFGILKNDYGFNRFLTRGKKNVKIEFTLLSFGYNINKLHNKIQNNRCGKALHEIKVA
ncbi:IS1182 family transposase ISCpe5 [bioreactor metagenome]|uniref:IS1182 family transposase ISCpe5 n=1 Tax=bioreactor metagenome TaxID=1076179 RepID=A0A645EDM2_9ZZZZ